MTNIERMAALAYDAFCRSICTAHENPDHYFETFFDVLDSDIRKAWVAATAAVIVATKNETDA